MNNHIDNNNNNNNNMEDQNSLTEDCSYLQQLILALKMYNNKKIDQHFQEFVRATNNQRLLSQFTSLIQDYSKSQSSSNIKQELDEIDMNSSNDYMNICVIDNNNKNYPTNTDQTLFSDRGKQ